MSPSCVSLDDYSFVCSHCGVLVVRHGITDRRSLRKKYCTEKCRRAAGWVRKRPEPKPRIPWNKGLHAADDLRVAELVKNLIVYKKGNKPWTTGKTHKEYPNIIHGPRVNTWKGGVTPEGIGYARTTSTSSGALPSTAAITSPARNAVPKLTAKEPS